MSRIYAIISIAIFQDYPDLVMDIRSRGYKTFFMLNSAEHEF